METTENEAYLTRQLITYLGNKRALLDFIGRGVREVQSRLGRERLTFADVFSGSGVVSRFFKQWADHILANDLELYCSVISRCYLASPDRTRLSEVHRALLRDMAAHPVTDGFIRRLYAPRDAGNIQKGERVFYTPENAVFLDTCRTAIGRLPADLQPYFLAPLLSEASVKCNTSGVFKGFYKDPRTGRGAWGGRAAGRARLCPVSARWAAMGQAAAQPSRRGSSRRAHSAAGVPSRPSRSSRAPLSFTSRSARAGAEGGSARVFSPCSSRSSRASS